MPAQSGKNSSYGSGSTYTFRSTPSGSGNWNTGGQVTGFGNISNGHGITPYGGNIMAGLATPTSAPVAPVVVPPVASPPVAVAAPKMAVRLPQAALPGAQPAAPRNPSSGMGFNGFVQSLMRSQQPKATQKMQDRIAPSAATPSTGIKVLRAWDSPKVLDKMQDRIAPQAPGPAPASPPISILSKQFYDRVPQDGVDTTTYRALPTNTRPFTGGGSGW